MAICKFGDWRCRQGHASLLLPGRVKSSIDSLTVSRGAGLNSRYGVYDPDVADLNSPPSIPISRTYASGERNKLWYTFQCQPRHRRLVKDSVWGSPPGAVIIKHAIHVVRSANWDTFHAARGHCVRVRRRGTHACSWGARLTASRWVSARIQVHT